MAEEKHERDRSITFSIPLLPPSMNSLYNVLFSLRKVELKPDVRLFKTKAKEYVPQFQVNSGDKVKLSMIVHCNCFYKNTNLKRFDVSNMVKVIQDLVCEKLGFDDAQVWETFARKVDSKEEEKAVVTLEILL